MLEQTREVKRHVKRTTAREGGRGAGQKKNAARIGWQMETNVNYTFQM